MVAGAQVINWKNIINVGFEKATFGKGFFFVFLFLWGQDAQKISPFVYILLLNKFGTSWSVHPIFVL